MSLSHLSIEQLNQAVSLLKRREAIQSQLEKIDHELRQIENGKFSSQIISKRQESIPASHATAKRPRRRKNVQRAVLKALKKAGAEGVNVKELAFRAKVKTNSLRTWLYTKGKSVEEIVRKGSGIFAYRSI